MLKNSHLSSTIMQMNILKYTYVTACDIVAAARHSLPMEHWNNDNGSRMCALHVNAQSSANNLMSKCRNVYIHEWMDVEHFHCTRALVGCRRHALHANFHKSARRTTQRMFNLCISRALTWDFTWKKRTIAFVVAFPCVPESWSFRIGMHIFSWYSSEGGDVKLRRRPLHFVREKSILVQKYSMIFVTFDCHSAVSFINFAFTAENSKTPAKVACWNS